MPRPFPNSPAPGRASVSLIILLLVVAAVGAWWYFAPETMPQWLVRPILGAHGDAPPLYKWRDEKGRLHVTDKPPVDRPYETVRYDPDTNVVPSGSVKPGR